MSNKVKKITSLMLGAFVTVFSFTGCSLTGDGIGEEFQSQQLTEVKYGEGDISYQESPYGIYSGAENLDELLVNGSYYVLHDGYYYPIMYDWTNIGEMRLELGGTPDPDRRAVFDATSITWIPTLFEEDKLFYYSTAGCYDYTLLERFKTHTWSIGISNLTPTVTGNIYFNIGEDMEAGVTSGTILTSEVMGLYDTVADEEKASDGTFMLKKVGGVDINEKNIENGVLIGLEKGKEYDLEIYSGTEYQYYSSTASVYYLNSYETYAIYEFIPNQDNLYEIVIPDYLLTGYYDVNGSGFVRLIRGEYYNDSTDYNEQLLFPYCEEIEMLEEDSSEEEIKAAEKKEDCLAGMYSEHIALNTFKAKDNTCFGWLERDEQGNILVEEGEAEGDGVAMDQFYEASTTRTSIWLPDGKDCVISVATTETTGYLYLEYESGSQRKIPYDRLLGGYVLELKGSDEKADIVVKGLYEDYKIKLTNAAQYRGQDKDMEISVEESTNNQDSSVQDVNE